MGAEFLPQNNVLPLVDLYIAHGGNSSLTEGLYFGVPVIVLPLFAAQPGNGIRVQEKGLGYTFHAYHVTEKELLTSIEKVLNDSELQERVKSVSKQMQNSDSLKLALDKIDSIVKSTG